MNRALTRPSFKWFTANVMASSNALDDGSKVGVWKLYIASVGSNLIGLSFAISGVFSAYLIFLERF